MEHVEGSTLHEILRQHGKTTAEAALVVLKGSLLGLAAAHERGVVHRDYKPANVLVTVDGVSKLTDFGIAAQAGGRAVPAGTLAYMAPEQFSGAPASPASDIYAATATFYECLTGYKPFSGDTATDLFEQHLHRPVPLDPVPEPLRRLIATGMAKDPEDRPGDAAAFISALEDAARYARRWEERGQVQLGGAARLPSRLLWVAIGILPPQAQERYREEFQGELAGIAQSGGGRLQQLSYSARVIGSAFSLRMALRTPKQWQAAP